MQQCAPPRSAACQRVQPTALGGATQCRALTGHSRRLLPGRRQQAGARPSVRVASFEKAPGSNAAETLVPDGAIKSLSPEARRIFREAQDNIIELNKSRLRALEELKAARQKIAELEGKLEQAVNEAQQATTQLQQLGPSSSQQAAAAGAAYAAAAATGGYQQLQQQSPPPPSPEPAQAPAYGGYNPYAQQQQQQQQQQMQPPVEAAPAANGPTITVVYETGWSAAFLHHNADGRGWTQSPGTKMQNGSQQFPEKKVITVPGRRMEFVINDGGSDWDKPNPYGDDNGPRNYVVESPGTYRLKNGKLTKLA